MEATTPGDFGILLGPRCASGSLGYKYAPGRFSRDAGASASSFPGVQAPTSFPRLDELACHPSKGDAKRVWFATLEAAAPGAVWDWRKGAAGVRPQTLGAGLGESRRGFVGDGRDVALLEVARFLDDALKDALGDVRREGLRGGLGDLVEQVALAHGVVDVQAVAAFDFTDALDELEPLGEQADNLTIDVVDRLA